MNQSTNPHSTHPEQCSHASTTTVTKPSKNLVFDGLKVGLIVAGVLLLGVLVKEQYNYHQFIKQKAVKWEKPAQQQIELVMNKQKQVSHQILLEFDRMIEKRKYAVNDFVDEVTSLSFATSNSGRSQRTIQDAVLNKFNQMVISESDINQFTNQMMNQYVLETRQIQDELVDSLELVFGETNSINPISQQLRLSSSDIAYFGSITSNRTIPLIIAEGVIDVAVTYAINAALVAIGLSSTSWYSLGLGLVAGVGIHFLMDAFDDSDDQLRASCIHALNKLKLKLRGQINEKLQQNIKRTKQHYLEVVSDMAKQRAEEAYPNGNGWLI